jgi:hypothetical protein
MKNKMLNGHVPANTEGDDQPVELAALEEVSDVVHAAYCRSPQVTAPEPIMKRYLLFDAGCELCTSIAQKVQDEAGRWLEVRRLSDPAMRALLDRHKPGWTHRPTLIVQDGDSVGISTGLALSIRLASGLGLRRAMRITRRVLTAISPPIARSGTPRRGFLRAIGTGAAALVGLAIVPRMAATSPQARENGPLLGSALKEAVAVAMASDDVTSAIERISAAGYDANLYESVAFRTDESPTVVMLFFPAKDTPESSAAVITHAYDGTAGPKTIVEFVSVDRAVIDEKDTLDVHDFTISGTTPGELAPLGAREYLGCMFSCMGVFCAVRAQHCRVLFFLSAILACMIAVCGATARICHQGCRRFW